MKLINCSIFSPGVLSLCCAMNYGRIKFVCATLLNYYGSSKHDRSFENNYEKFGGKFLHA